MPILRRLWILNLLVLLLVTTLNGHANAQLELDITRGTVKKIPLAVSNFHYDNERLYSIGNGMGNIIRDNLERTGLFDIPDHKAYIQDPASTAEQPRFPEWKALGVEGLVSGKVTEMSDGRARVEFRLWDVYGQKQLTGMAYTTTKDNWRRIAHIISDAIYKRLTGEEGYFDSRIVYIAEKGLPTARIKRLAIMDQDGANHQYLTDGSHLVLTPRFSPNMQMITYLSYYRNKPRVYIYDLNTGRQEVLGDFPGMTFSPRFSPDGKSVIMSLAKNGNTDIYVLNIASKKAKKITGQPSIETSPSYAPDGKQIVFESDRSGSQQIYVMKADGSDAKRITFEKGRYANPVWSPRGDLIAFTKMLKGKFYIGVIRPDGSGERLITSAYHVEGPSWSPNGRVLTYFKERPQGDNRVAKLYTIDLTGYNERLLLTPMDGSDPAWSPTNAQ
tara:strand:+ start:187707 stop:189038 length:1332 start_codon:yes stop_codon:yes gene_type:complete